MYKSTANLHIKFATSTNFMIFYSRCLFRRLLNSLVSIAKR